MPPQPGSAHVLIRFGMRLVVLGAFAAFASIGFARGMIALLWMSTLLSAVIGGIRREPLMAPKLNHWDEMAAYGALCALITAIDRHI